VRIGITTLSFNQRPFLGEAIRSVNESSVRSLISYVVVDPGSSDGSLELIKREKHCIDKVVLGPDSGPAEGLNKGFAACPDCELLAYINADDRIRPDAAEYALEFFRRYPETDVLLGAVAMIDGEGRRSKRARTSDEFNLERFAMGACLLCQQGTFLRRKSWERAGGFNPRNRTCWDAELLVDMALTGARIRTVNKILGEFRIHPASITGSGRTNDSYDRDRRRINEKIWAHGIRRPRFSEATIRRTLYHINPWRQLSYLRVK
jgi:glycosyltransferase involved in cell wall biosynthesis